MKKFKLAENKFEGENKLQAVGFERWINFRGGAKFASLVHDHKFRVGHDVFCCGNCHKSERIAGEMADKFDRMKEKPDYFILDSDGNLYDKVVLENGEMGIVKNGDLLSNHCDYKVSGR